MDLQESPIGDKKDDVARPRVIHVSAPAVVHVAIRAAAIFVVATWIAGMASAEFWNLLDGGPDAEFTRAAYAIGSALSLALAVAMWFAAPYVAGFANRSEAEVRRPFDLADGLILVLVWLGLSDLMLAAQNFLRALVAWISAGGFQSTPEELPMRWYGDALISAFATGVIGVAIVLAAGPLARWLAKQAGDR
jgi:hypothetical protein